MGRTAVLNATRGDPRRIKLDKGAGSTHYGSSSCGKRVTEWVREGASLYSI